VSEVIKRMDAAVSTRAGVAVFSRIMTHGPIARIEIARATGLSQAAITKAVVPLIDGGFVAEIAVDRFDAGVGRPVNPLVISPNRVYAVGVKITASEAIGVITDLRATILATVHRSLSSSTVAEVIDTVDTVVAELFQKHPVARSMVAGVGVTVSGDVDPQSGVIRHSPLLGWRDVDLAALLDTRLALPVFVENDVRALTIAEHWFGLGVDAASFAVVTIGTGIGCGIFTNGDVVSGAYGVSGEIGHLPLAAGNLLCTCGRRGCVETVASSQAIVTRIQNETGTQVDLAGAIDLVRAGDGHARAAFAAAGEVIGSALAAMVNLVGPELVVIAGEGVADYDLYGAHIQRTFSEHAFGAAAQCTLEVRSHSFDDWARGAAAAVIREFVRSGL
jgi:predicted NBD/HSP70 family sugar kinase